MQRLTLFISSAFRTLQYEREFLALVCERMGWEAQAFPEQSIAGSPGRDYLRALREADVLVYMVGQQRSAATDRELELAREIGLPIVPFARWQRTRAGGRRKPKAAEDFLAQTGAEFVQMFDSLRELDSGLIEGVSAVIAARVARANVSLQPYSEHLYVEAREMLDLADRRYGVSQQTSTLALGPNRKRMGAEDIWMNDWHKALLSTLDGNSQRECVHIFDSQATLAALRDEPTFFPGARDAVAFMRTIMPRLPAQSGVRIIARTIPVAPAVLADGGLLIPATYEVSHYFRVRYALSAANQLWDVLGRIASEQTDAMGELDQFVTQMEALL